MKKYTILIFLTLVAAYAMLQFQSAESIIDKGGHYFFKTAFLILGFKTFNWLTPKIQLIEEIKAGNVAAAMLGGAMILATALVVGFV